MGIPGTEEGIGWKGIVMDCSVLCMLYTCTYINRVGQETREGRTERGREGGGGGGGRN